MNKKSLLKCAVIGLVATFGLAACGTSKDASGGSSSGKEVLEFYHGYHHSEDEWPVAKTMRDLYDKFAEEHKDSGVEFKPTPVNGDLKDIMNNKVASGEFPDVIDLAGNAVSLAAIEQKLVLDLKPYIDSNKLEKNVGLNYKQNQKDGVYAFGAGEPSIRLFNTVLGTTENGRKLLDKPLTKEGIESKEFADALKMVMKEIQANGSKNAGGDANAYSKDFQEGKSAVFFNGVWASGEMSKNPSLAPGIYPAGVAISSSGGGITISSKMSEAKQKLALEFLKYMTSDDVQKVIFEKVGANPSNENVNVKELSEKSSEATTKILGQAITQVKNAKAVVPTVSDVWGGDVHTAIINALTESAAENVDVDQKVKSTQDVLKSLIG